MCTKTIRFEGCVKCRIRLKHKLKVRFCQSMPKMTLSVEKKTILIKCNLFVRFIHWGLQNIL